MSWYVLYTKPRNEKKLAQRLAEKGVKVYCPLREEVKQWSDRKKKVAEPVFKSYIFVHFDNYKEESVPVLSTQGAVRFLWWNGKPGVVRDFEIQAIEDFLNDYKDVTVIESFSAGERVTVMEGPLRESKGKILMISGNKAVLHLHTLGLNMTAKIPVQSITKDEEG